MGSKLQGIVLSGGEGSRMGGDKGLMLLKGKPLFLWTVEALSSVTEGIVISVGSGMVEMYASRAPGFRIVEDATPGLGPAGGFLSALGVAETEYVCVAPCDSPLISPAVYRLLESKAGGRDAAVPKIRGMFEPLHAVYRREPFLKCLEKIVARGGRRPVLAYESMDVCEVDGDELKKLDPRLATFFNVNTKEDLEAAELLLR